MKITSPAFHMNQAIPSMYTCDGDNINPLLEFSAVPVGAQSLALVMHDPDVPKSLRADGNFDHWVVFNLPPTTTRLAVGAKIDEGLQGNNTRGAPCYTGPCPPDKEHRYIFTLYALDIMLPLAEGATRQEVEKAMQGHVLATALLVGTYNRR